MKGKEIELNIMKKNKSVAKLVAKKVIGSSNEKRKSHANAGTPSKIDSANKTNVSSDDKKSNESIERVESSAMRRSVSDQKEKLFDELVRRQGSVEKLLQVKTAAKTVYDVDRMSPIEIRESLARVDAKTIEPFTFLAEIIDCPDDDSQSELMRDDKSQEFNPTDIDLQLASLLKRVELNKTLLEKANQRIKEINFLTERNNVNTLRETNYDEKSFLKFKEAGDSNEPVSVADLKTAVVTHPAVDELKKTMSTTIEMLAHVQKMSNGDFASGEIPQELTDYLSGSM